MIKHGSMHDMSVAENPEACHSGGSRFRRNSVTGIFRVFVLLPVLLAAASQAAAEALPSMPVMMYLYGAISPSSDGKLAAADGDTLLVVNVPTGATEATGAVGSGSYAMYVDNKPPSLNGTQLVLYLKHINTLYRLLNATGGDAIITFNGSILPQRTQVNLVATSQVVGTTPPPGTGTTPPPGTVTPPPAAVLGDLNGDGVVNEVDVGLLKQAISGEIPVSSTKMDMNNDGVVNTRDLIDMIRMVREQSRAKLVPASIVPVRR